MEFMESSGIEARLLLARRHDPLWTAPRRHCPQLERFNCFRRGSTRTVEVVASVDLLPPLAPLATAVPNGGHG